MATATSTSFATVGGTRGGAITINAAFLHEIKEINEELWQLLETIAGICERPARLEFQTREVVELLGQSQDDLAMHFALEEYFGYFEEPVKVSAELAGRVAELRAEHDSLYCQLSRLTDQSELLWYHGQVDRLTSMLPIRFRAFYDQLKGHEAREKELIVDVFRENQLLFERMQLRDDDLVPWAIKSLPEHRLDDGFADRVLRTAIPLKQPSSAT